MQKEIYQSPAFSEVPIDVAQEANLAEAAAAAGILKILVKIVVTVIEEIAVIPA